MTAIQLHHWHNPASAEVANSHHTFLAQLPGPTVIHVDGEDRARTRVIVTLLHANEPSGLKAIHQLLRQGIKPVVNLKLFIVSVGAAKTPPLFTHRMLPGKRDLNRCFRAPYYRISARSRVRHTQYLRQRPCFCGRHYRVPSNPSFSLLLCP